jgi:hypothetical protein
VPCPSEEYLPQVLAPERRFNCAGLAFETWNDIGTLAEVEAKLKACTKLDDPKKKCDKSCDKKCYLWTFDLMLYRVDPTGKPIGRGQRVSHDFHLVCACAGCGMAISKDGPRPVDPRVGPAEIFEPKPYPLDPKIWGRQIEKIENLRLQVFCCKLSDLQG